MVSLLGVRRLADKYRINTNVLPIATLKKGIEVELEHRNLIGHSAEKALIIALAHLRETPRYYDLLEKMEEREKKYWSSRRKPDIFINNNN